MWNVIKMALKSLLFAAKSQNCPAAGGSALRPLSTVTEYSETMPRLRHTWAASIRSARGINQAILGQKKTFGLLLLSKIMVVRLVAFTAADKFFNLIMGRRRNELRNTAGLVLKLHIFVAVQDLIISFYSRKVQFILVPPPPAFG